MAHIRKINQFDAAAYSCKSTHFRNSCVLVMDPKLKLPLLVSIVLTDESRKKLEMSLGEPKINNTLKPEQCLHHITLAFKPNQFQYKAIVDKTPIGRTIAFIPHMRFWSEKFGVEAMTIKKLDEFVCHNRFPHITIAANGKPPSASNELLETALSLKDLMTEELSWIGELTGIVSEK